MRRPDRFASEPLLTILGTASIAPSAVQKAIDRQAALYGYSLLRGSHPYLRRIRHATSLNVVEIKSRYNRLLVSIEQVGGKRVPWFYREFKGSYCSFRCRAQVPQTIAINLRNRPLSVVTDDIAPLADVTIAGVDEDYGSDDWLNLKLAPTWASF